MTPQFHQHPDNWVYVRTDAGIYCDRPDKFALDYGQSAPALPAGADERLYVQGIRHAICAGGNLIAGAEDPYAFGDAAIAAIATLLSAQAARLAPPPG